MAERILFAYQADVTDCSEIISSLPDAPFAESDCTLRGPSARAGYRPLGCVVVAGVRSVGLLPAGLPVFQRPWMFCGFGFTPWSRGGIRMYHSGEETKPSWPPEIISKTEIIALTSEGYFDMLRECHGLLALGPSRHFTLIYTRVNFLAAMENHARGTIMDPQRSPITQKDMRNRHKLRRRKRKSPKPGLPPYLKSAKNPAPPTPGKSQ